MKKQSLSVLAVLASTLILITSCGSNESKPAAESNSAAPATTAEQSKTEQAPVITTVAIAGNNWMTENLKATTFSNGEAIKEAKTTKEWISAINSKTPAYRTSDGIFFYNIYAIKDARGIAPAGFKVPSISDFKSLSKALGAGTSVDGKAAIALANYVWEIEEWNESTGDLGMTTIKGTNSSGFNATKGGYCYQSGEINLGGCSYWWTSEGGTFDIGYCSQDLGGGITQNAPAAYGFEVRCVKN